MRSGVTKYEKELVELAQRFLDAARDNAESCAVLERYGYDRGEHERGLLLVREALRAFRWEHDGKAWNFLSPTPERRILEAREWHRTTRRRHLQTCLRRAEEAAGWIGTGQASNWPIWRKLTLGTLAGVRHALSAVAPRTWVDHRSELRRNVKRARGQRPTGAPPPKDAALVELAGWYERWRLVAHRVFRQRPDLMAPYGLTPGKAPPRLRGKGAAQYGEKAAGRLPGSPAPDEEIDADDDAFGAGAVNASDRRERLPVVG